MGGGGNSSVNAVACAKGPHMQPAAIKVSVSVQEQTTRCCKAGLVHTCSGLLLLQLLAARLLQLACCCLADGGVDVLQLCCCLLGHV